MSRVKICGVSRAEDIEAVNSALPEYIGFVFAESRRRVDEKTAAMLRKGLDKRIEAAGVFVNEDIEKVIGLYDDGIIDIVQLHGDEDVDYIDQLRESCGCRIIKAVRVGSILPSFPSNPDFLLFDSLSAECAGKGKMFDWHLVKGFDKLPYFLAGGLNAANVRDAIGSLSPYCVDVSSGVETRGVKDASKIKEFVNLAREAD